MRCLLLSGLALMAALMGRCQTSEALIRELNLDGDLAVRLTCPNPAGWSFSVEAGRLDGDRQTVDIRLVRAMPATPPQFNLRMLKPQCRIRHLWTVNDNLFPISPFLIGERVSSLCENMPLYVYLDDASTNRLAIGLSESERHVVFHGGVEEVGARIFSSFDFFAQPEAPLTNYHLTVCLDTGARHLADAVPSMVRWVERASGKHPCVAPPAAFEPLYSTWYGFHQDVKDRAVEAECERAAALGMKTVIVDDGWQMEEAGSAYRYCGDWHPAKSRFPDMAAHVRRVQSLGLKYMLWYSVPFVGRDSKNAARFKDKSLYYLERSGAYVLDPRFPEVRAFLVETYVQAARNWNLDGFKLDFIDRFRIEGVDPAVAENYAGRDIKSVPKAVDQLLSEIREALLAIRPDMLIEFRQSYIGPGIRSYGNMLRAGDCPGDLRQNRVAIANLRLVSGESAVHADMLEWNLKATPEDAALNVLAALFGTVQYSQVLREAPPDHLRMMRHWIAFSKRHRSALLRGWFRPHHPELSYPVIESGDDSEHVLAVYAHNTIVDIGGGEPVKIVINATDADTVCVRLPCAMKAVLYDTFGSRTGILEVKSGLVMLPVPRAGYAELAAVGGERVLAFADYGERRIVRMFGFGKECGF